MMKRYLILIAIISVVTAASSLLAQAQTPAAPTAGYEISWYTIDGGGGSSSGGSYQLDGTIGQADAGALSGGGYTLNDGFWGGAALNYNIYLPLVLKG